MKIRPASLGFGLMLLAAAALISLGVGRRMDHHYDEFGYLYAATHYSPRALAAGQFEASNVHGFFNAKMGHVVLLRWIAGVTGAGQGALWRIEAFYSLLVILTCLLWGWVAWRLWQDKAFALAVAAVSLLMPVTVYLAPKLMSDVPGTFWATLGVVFLVEGLLCRKAAARWGLIVLCAVALAAGVLSRATVALLAVGAGAALWAAPPPRVRRRTVVISLILLGLLATFVVLLIDRWMQLGLFEGVGVLDTVLHQHMSRQELVRRIYGAFGPALWVAPIALASWKRQRSQLLCYGLLALCGIGPVPLLHSIEERYLVTGMPGIAGLAVMGGRALWRSIGSPRSWIARGVGVAVVAGVLAASNISIQPGTIHELDTALYGRTMAWITAHYPNRPILIPWTWSDFHYLRMAYPTAPVYTVNTRTFFDSSSNYAKTADRWLAAESRWYGLRHVPDRAALARLGPAPWVYVSWRTPGWGTDQFSWLRDDPALLVVPVHTEGKYIVYEVRQAGR